MTWAGSAVIVASGLYTLMRSQRREKPARDTAAAP